MSGRRQPPGPDQIVERLRRHLELLGLNHTLAGLDEHLAWALREKPGAATLLERVLGAEAAFKLERRIERRIENSGLPERKTLEAFDWAFQPDLDKSFVMDVAGLEFVRRKEDLVITGKTGTGKSHLLQAFGLRACQQQMYVRYARCVDLLDDLYAGLADATYPRRLKRWAAPDLLIIDDVGLGQVKKRDDEPTAAHTLFNLIDRRHGPRLHRLQLQHQALRLGPLPGGSHPGRRDPRSHHHERHPARHQRPQLPPARRPGARYQARHQAPRRSPRSRRRAPTAGSAGPRASGRRASPGVGSQLDNFSWRPPPRAPCVPVQGSCHGLPGSGSGGSRSRRAPTPQAQPTLDHARPPFWITPRPAPKHRPRRSGSCL